MMTKTITIHALDNCGSGLQSYALQQYLIQNGIENEIIDYRPWYIHNNGRPLDWKFFIKRIIFLRGLKKRRKIYDDFVANYLNCTDKVYKSYEALKKEEFQANYFITGSDQIWNSYFECGKDRAYYLSFLKGTAKKVSYAASLGRTYFDEKKIAFLHEQTKDFQFITVREKSAISILQQAGQVAVQVCDPTFLLDATQYRKNERNVINGDYILVYLTQSSELLDSALEILKKKYNAKVVYVGSFLNRCKCDVNLTNVGPWEFVGLIDHACFVVAGSFHATVFSSILKISFAVFPYENNIRMQELLEGLGLENRFIQSENDLNILEQEISIEKFCQIDRIMEAWRKNAKECFLDKL